MTDYLVKNYIAEEPKFPHLVWATQSSSNKLTTNACKLF